MAQKKKINIGTVKTGAIKIGTRGSLLAVTQSQLLVSILQEALSAEERAEYDFELVKIKTTGDMIQDRPLSDVDGKSLFTKEIEEALLGGDIDFAIHSMKDVPYQLPDGLEISTVVNRKHPWDAFIAHKDWRDMPKGATIGTSSLRRKYQLLQLRPDFNVIPLRGNVDTRLRKLNDGQIDGTILAQAGLHRLGKEEVICSLFSIEEMVPAIAQGALGIEVRQNDEFIKGLLSKIHNEETYLNVKAERLVMKLVEATCHTPLGVYSQIKGQRIVLHGFMSDESGERPCFAKVEGERENYMSLAQELATKLTDT